MSWERLRKGKGRVGRVGNAGKGVKSLKFVFFFETGDSNLKCHTDSLGMFWSQCWKGEKSSMLQIFWMMSSW